MANEVPLDAETSLIVEHPPPERPTLEKDVQALRGAFRVEALRVLVTPNAHVYLTILQRLRLARKYENGDIAHDELYETVRETVRRLTGDELDARSFVDRLQELLDAVLIEREWEPRSDQSINSFLWDYHRYRISDEANRLLTMLERAARSRGRKPSSVEARHSLRIIRERLAAIQDQTRTIYSDPQLSGEERRKKAQVAYQDLARLFRQEFTEFKDFLSDLNQLLHDYGRSANPTSYEQLDRLIERLETYVDEMLGFVQVNSEAIASSCTSILLRGVETLETGYVIDTSESTDPFTREAPTSDTHPDPNTILVVTRAYFGDDGQGTLREAVRRIREATVATIKSLREHYERLLQRTHFGEYLKFRVQEVAALTPTPGRFDPIVDWANNLFFPRAMPSAPRLGTPGEPGVPIPPRKSYEYQRPPILGVKAERPRSDPPDTSRRRAKLIVTLNEFVHARVLKGRDTGKLSELEAPTFQEFRVLIEAVKSSNLIIGGPLSDELTFSIEDHRRRPQDPLELIEWRSEDARYLAPELTFRKKAPQDPWQRRTSW